MLKRKLGGIITIILMISLSIGSVYSTASYDRSPEGKVDAIEAALRGTNIKDFENSGFYNNLSENNKTVFKYFYNVTGGDLAITSEVFGQAGTIWSRDEMTLYNQYITGNESVRQDIKNNPWVSQRLGYLHKYVSDWQHLSKKEKIQFFNTDKHDLSDALDLLNRVDSMELLYINGAMLGDKQANLTGYGALANAFARLEKLTPNDVTDKDMKIFNEGADRFTNSVFDYHDSYKIMNSTSKENVFTYLNESFTDNPDQVDVLSQLHAFSDGIDDIADQTHKLGKSGVISGGLGTGFGSAFTIAGIITLVVGACLGQGPIILAGLGLLTTGLFFIGFTTPHLPNSVHIKDLGDKMQDLVSKVKPIIATMIAGIEAEQAAHNTGD
jgi:hypothetical protein